MAQGPASLEDASPGGVAGLVSVVIPAYNSEATIDETLASARAQTYPPIEIFVVDDGSSDATVDRVLAHVEADERVTLVRQPNGGVSSARNTGVAFSRGEFLAFLDADDLWNPTKIAKQVAALQRAGPQAAVAYNWSCLIDEGGRILNGGRRELVEGRVLGEFCRRDRIGNGSTALIRRSAFLEVGGYDPACDSAEDLKIHLQLAERYEFALVPEELTGYRLRRGSACDNFDRALAAQRRATELFRSHYPQYAPVIDLQRKELAQWFVSRALYNFKFAAAIKLLAYLAEQDAAFAAYSAAFVLARPLLMMLNRARTAAPRLYKETFRAPSSDGDGGAVRSPATPAT